MNDNVFLNNSDKMNFSDSIYSFHLFIKTKNSTNQINATSGTSFEVEFILTDYFNQTLNFDNATIAIIKQNSTNGNQSILIQNGFSQSRKGILSYPNLLIKIQPDSLIQLTVSGIFAGLSNNFKNELNSFQLEFSFLFYFRKCFMGEILKSDKSCYFCPLGSYSFIDPMPMKTSSGLCNPCPINSFCYGGIYVTPLPGYYRKYNTSLNAVKCFKF